MDKVYVLQQKFGNINAGAKLNFDGKGAYHLLATYVGETEGYSVLSLPKDFVENNPKWFIEKKEQEWEILAVRGEDGALWYTDMKPKMNENIDTVKRLSDGQTFSVGDKWSGDIWYTLTAFKIEDGVMLHEMNNNGYFYDALTLVPPTQPQQPPQEEQKDNDVFVWNDTEVERFIKEGMCVGQTISDAIRLFKASKSTLASEKIEVIAKGRV